MANKTIKTRILLRNDTLANWESNASGASPLILAKGEVAIATINGNLAEVRVGTGTSNWNNALKLRIDASQISGIVDTIEGVAKQYRLEAGSGSDLNKWFLQEKAMSATSWTTVSTLDLNVLTGYALSTDVNTKVADALGVAESYAVSAIGQAQTFANNVLTSANNYTDGKITNISGTVDGKFLTKADFNTISTAIGLNAANSSNKVVTQKDIAALDNVMHFGGIVKGVPTTSGYTVKDVGTIVVDTTSGKEYVLVNTSTTQTPTLSWEEIGDQNIYATKTEVSAYATKTEVSAYALSTNVANNYVDKTSFNAISSRLTSDIDTLSGDVKTLKNAGYALSTDVNTKITQEINKLDVAKTENGNAGAGFVKYVTEADGKISVEKKTVQLSDITDYASTISSYALSTDVNTAINAAKNELKGTSSDLSSVESIAGAKKYAADKVAELSSGFLVFDCGGASLRTNEPTASLIGA